ncbi:MAG: hypothetical protein II272_08440, partial [Oscillospiraceae bacterium]|nr:hypothetical protein [Oscillospiraceae bacterium]
MFPRSPKAAPPIPSYSEEKPKFHAPSTDAHQALGSPSVYRCPPSSWLSLRESWRKAPERAHCTDSSDKLPSDPLHRFLIRNCIPARTVCTSLSPSLRESWREAPERAHCTDSMYELHFYTNCLHIPLPLP